MSSAPETGDSFAVAAQLAFDEIHPRIAEVGWNLDTLVEIRIPFEIIEQLKLVIVYTVNFAMYCVSTVQTYRREIVEFIHPVFLSGDEFADILGFLQKMGITLATLQGAIDKNAMQPVIRHDSCE